MKKGRSVRAQKKLRFRPHLVCIIEDVMNGGGDNKDEMNGAMCYIVNKLVSTKLPFKLTSISQVCLIFYVNITNKP